MFIRQKIMISRMGVPRRASNTVYRGNISLFTQNRVQTNSKPLIFREKKNENRKTKYFSAEQIISSIAYSNGNKKY